MDTHSNLLDTILHTVYGNTLVEKSVRVINTLVYDYFPCSICLEQTLLTFTLQMAHMAMYGKARDFTKKCYGWRNCAKLGSSVQGQNNADSLALFALALWFVIQGICVTENGNLVSASPDFRECGAMQPALSNQGKAQDQNLAQQAQSPNQANVPVQPFPGTGGGVSNSVMYATYDATSDSEVDISS